MTENADPGAERIAWRRAVLRRFGASGPVADELLAYNASTFKPLAAAEMPVLPLEDEPHLEAWSQYEEQARSIGAIEALRPRLVQLRFPIEKGISETEGYRNSTRKGHPPPDGATPLAIDDPESIQLVLHESPAGRIPVLEVGRRSDFEKLVQAFSARNEPWPVPASMGACIVTGLNNWDRVASYRHAWETQNPGAGSSGWSEEFKRFSARKANYQDRFIILSSGPYSGVPAEDARFDPDDWIDLSMRIRREHESTHYFTFRILGSMRNNLIDEVVADWAGLIRSFGTYRPDLALLFFGLERFPAYRQGGRLENYRGTPSLSDAAFDVLQCLVVEAVGQLSRIGRLVESGDANALARALAAIGSLTLEELATEEVVLEACVPFIQHRPVRTLRVRVHRKDSDLSTIIDAVERVCREARMPRLTFADLALVLDEVLSNVIKYGYDDENDHEFDLEVRVGSDEVEVEVVDDGKPFNALERDDPDTELGLDERPIGGLGIYLVKKLTDFQQYEYRDGQNHLYVRKSFEPGNW